METLGRATELRNKLKSRRQQCRGLLPGTANDQAREPGSANVSTSVNGSEIPVSRKNHFIPLSEEEQRDAESYIANARRSGLKWTRITKGYAQRFGVQRHGQYFRRTYPQYFHSRMSVMPVNAGRT